MGEHEGGRALPDRGAVPVAGPAETTTSRRGPLVGVRVIDLGQLVAAPLAATLLADLGADVVKVERPDGGDPLRSLGPKKGSVSLWSKTNSRNKRTITLDLKNPDDKETLLQLVEQADAVLENFIPGTLERLGLGEDVLRSRNRRVILLRISGYGQTGPRRLERGFGRSAEGFSGLTYATGEPDRPPLNISAFPLADCVTGVFGALSVLAAIVERDHGDGTGQQIDLALYESIFRLLENHVIAYDQLGTIPERQGTGNAYAYPAGTWLSKEDTWVSFTVSTEAMAKRFFTAIGREDLIDDPRFATNASRLANRDQLEPIITAWVAEHSEDEILKDFAAHDLAVTRILDIEDIFNEAQYRARGNLIAVADEDLGELRMQGVVPHFSKTPGIVRHAGHGLDADREEILRDWLDGSQATPGCTESENGVSQ